jgi:endonuclease/exonuclease/phosphatase family metal-dependent hydrolase
MKQTHILFIAFALALVAQSARAETVRLVSWNVKRAVSIEAVQARHGDLREAGRDLQPDILVLQEVNSPAIVREIANLMGIPEFYAMTSDFVPDGASDNAREVAILSRWPFSLAAEFDPSVDGRAPGNEFLMVLPEHIPFVETDRGFLTAYIPFLELTVTAVDLAESGGKVGEMDEPYARKRERVVAAVAAELARLSAQRPELTHVVAGDFGVGVHDLKRNGRLLEIDCATKHCEPGETDGYDDTHAILSDGLVAGYRMRNLGERSRQRSYVTSAIDTPHDTIYVQGRDRERFIDLVVLPTSYGSDHYPVITTLTPAPDAVAAAHPAPLQDLGSPARPARSRLRVLHNPWEQAP